MSKSEITVNKVAFQKVKIIRTREHDYPRYMFSVSQTGNLFLKGREYKLEPALDELNRRELPSHLGTPHRMEALPIDTRVGGIKKAANGANVMEAVRGVGPDKFNDDFVVCECIMYYIKSFLRLTPNLY